MEYVVLDHTADAYVECSGGTLERCFGCAAYAMYDQMVDASRIEAAMERELEVSGETHEERLYAMLSELIFITDTENTVFSEFEVKFRGNAVECVARGEPLDVRKHDAKTEVKAVTYHGMEVDPEKPSVRVLFDL